MKYTVIWRPETLNQLIEFWLEATDRETVSAATARIDCVLRADPESQGESREENTRVLLVEPLGVEYEVDVGDRKVQVNTVWLIR